MVEVEEEWADPGAEATVRGTVFKFISFDAEIEKEGTVDTGTPGIYEIKYRATYKGETEEVVRTVVVRDDVPPTITLEGGDVVTIVQGTPYEDRYSADDNIEGDITGNVQILGKVNEKIVGEYELTYVVEDTSGNKVEAKRWVEVEPAPRDEKVIYLTFDDGPGKYTSRLLDILKEYDAKATFFITGASPKHFDCIGRAYKEGHTVAVHTYSHRYDQIYSGTEAYWADFEKVEDLIEKQTGQRTNLFRFPGGSSNEISINYTPGIMTELVREAAEKGYIYFDWNIISGDAGETTDRKEVFKNITEGVAEKEYAVVLCHDIKEFTVEAMEDVLRWGKQNGYVFEALTEESPTVHHSLNN